MTRRRQLRTVAAISLLVGVPLGCALAVAWWIYEMVRFATLAP